MAAEYTLILGTKNLSSWSLRAWLALSATGAPFAEEKIVLDRPDTKAKLLAQSPAGKVPVLKIYEHKHVATVWDSLAIAETLAERHPQAHLWPINPTKRMLARAYAAEMHSSFATLRAELPMNFARKLPLPDLSAPAQADVKRILEAWSTALAENRILGDFLFGAYSLADVMYAPVVSRFVTYDVPVPEIVRAYCVRMMALAPMCAWRTAAEAEVAAGLG